MPIFTDKAINQAAKKAEKNGTEGRSILETIGHDINNVGGFLFNNTAKFLNQTGAEGNELYDTLRMLVAQHTGNQEAWSNANKDAKKDYNNFGNNGGIFNVGTLTNKKETKKGDLKTGIEKIGGGALGTAAEILPFARGATLARSGAKVGEKIARGAIEGALYGGAYNTAVGLENNNLSPEEVLKGALIGGALGGGVGGVLGRFGSKGVKTASKAKDTPMFSDEAIDEAVANTNQQKLLSEGRAPRQGNNFERLNPEDAVNRFADERGLPAGEQKALPQGEIKPLSNASLTTIGSPQEEQAIQSLLSIEPQDASTVYHGTKGSLDHISELDSLMYGDPQALYGPGTYLTDNIDVAKGYGKTKGYGSGSRILRGKLVPGTKLLDLDKKLSPEASRIFDKYIDPPSTISVGGEKIELPGGKPTEGMTGAEAVKTLQEIFNDGLTPTSEAHEIFLDLQHDLKNAGYQGFKHIGGKNKDAQHNVSILFNVGDDSGLPIIDVGRADLYPDQNIQTGFIVKSPTDQYATNVAQKRIDEIDQEFSKAQQTGAEFNANSYRELNRERSSLQQVVSGEKTLGEHRLAEENGFPAQSEKIDPDLAEKDLSQTTPQEAQNSIAEARFGPGAKSIYEDTSEPLEEAKASLLGVEPSPSISERVSRSSTRLPDDESPLEAGAKNVAEKIEAQDEVLHGINEKYSNVTSALNKGSIKRNARKWSWLNHYTDTMGTAARFLGKTGTDIVDKMAEGAKKVSDIQELVMNDVQKSQKLMKQLAKSETGKTELQSRIYDALEDRTNAAQYLHGDKEMELFQSVANVLDTFKKLRVNAGKAVVGENYSPRAVIRDALNAPETMWQQMRSTFGGVESPFSKSRYADIADEDINKNIVDLLPTYISSQSKELAYEGAINFAKDAIKDINPVYLTNSKDLAEGKKYMGHLIQQALEPRHVSDFERFQNKLLGNTYKAQLGFSPRFALQNMTQRFVARGAVSKEADKLAKVMDKADTDALRQGIHSGDNPIMESINVTPESVGSNKGWFGKYDIGHKVERGNIHYAFDRGVSQAVVKSEPYKIAIKQGFTPKEASKIALKNPDIREQAIRHGNVVVNTTQFGANFITKPEFFRNSGTFFGLSDRWYKQYHRFPMGMMQNIATIMNANDARALDILRRGNPLESKMVDFRHGVEAYQNAANDLLKAVKKGEVNNISLDEAVGYKKTLDHYAKELDENMKKASELSGAKQAKYLGKMWGSAAMIQFLFNGGGDPGRAILYSAPINIPTRSENPLSGATMPSSPISDGKFSTRKALNLVPGVGLPVSRAYDVERFMNGLTGDNSQ